MNTHYFKFAIIGAAAVLLAGCPTAPKQETPPPAHPPKTEAPPPVSSAPQETCSKLLGRCVKRNAAGPITAKANCAYRDPSGGYGGKLKLALSQSHVDDLDAEIQTKRGKCKFVGKDFHQESESSIVLKANSGRCTVRIWMQEGKLVVGFSECKDRCQSDSFDYVWPIKLDMRTGQCS